MRTEIDAERLRQELDKKLTWLRRHRIERPMRGWIYHIREALTMTGGELASRLGVTASTVTALQKSEVKGTIEIATLRKVAAAMECRLFYTFVPNIRLQEIMRQRRKRIATTQIAQVTRDALNLREQRTLVEDWAKLVPRNMVWRALPRFGEKLRQQQKEKEAREKKEAEAMIEKAVSVLEKKDKEAAKQPEPPVLTKFVKRMTPEEKKAKKARFNELLHKDVSKRTPEERKEFMEIDDALIDDENAEGYEKLTPEEKAEWDRLEELEIRWPDITPAEDVEYKRLAKYFYDEDDETHNGGEKEASRNEPGNKNNAAENEDKDDEKKGAAADDSNSDEARNETDEEPKAPMTMAKVALVLGAGLKGVKQPETKASDTLKPKPDIGGPRIRML